MKEKSEERKVEHGVDLEAHDVKKIDHKRLPQNVRKVADEAQ